MDSVFFENVKNMRLAQKSYFKTRDKYWLKKSKDFEKLVDDLIDLKANPKLGL